MHLLHTLVLHTGIVCLSVCYTISYILCFNWSHISVTHIIFTPIFISLSLFISLYVRSFPLIQIKWHFKCYLYRNAHHLYHERKTENRNKSSVTNIYITENKNMSSVQCDIDLYPIVYMICCIYFVWNKYKYKCIRDALHLHAKSFVQNGTKPETKSFSFSFIRVNCF